MLGKKKMSARRISFAELRLRQVAQKFHVRAFEFGCKILQMLLFLSSSRNAKLYLGQRAACRTTTGTRLYGRSDPAYNTVVGWCASAPALAGKNNG